jgi:hypothetical protein
MKLAISFNPHYALELRSEGRKANPPDHYLVGGQVK